ncbi:MAG: hypothetical protein FJ290_22610 [Planctomycetes bacterium]|nr:hypothetical protein [Planctomycetota bacterium]
MTQAGFSKRMIVLALGLTGFFASGAEDPQTPLRPGDTVKVANGPASLMLGEETLTTIEVGTVLRVTEVKDGWVGVAVTRGNKKIEGWIEAAVLELVERHVKEPGPAKAQDEVEKAAPLDDKTFREILQKGGKLCLSVPVTLRKHKWLPRQ